MKENGPPLDPEIEPVCFSVQSGQMSFMFLMICPDEMHRETRELR